MSHYCYKLTTGERGFSINEVSRRGVPLTIMRCFGEGAIWLQKFESSQVRQSHALEEFLKFPPKKQ